MTKSYLLIGHVADDVASDGRIVTGGTVTYASVAAKRFGWKPIVVTAATADFQRPSYLDSMDWHILPSSHTTTFKNEDGRQGRTQVVGPVARSITAADNREALSPAALPAAPPSLALRLVWCTEKACPRRLNRLLSASYLVV